MQTFTKAERLSGKVAIDTLFTTGRSFHNSPIKIFWLEVSESISPVQIVISVPKRLFKSSVDRNRLKRLFREVYRKNKDVVLEKLGNKKVHLMFIYTSKTMVEYKELEEKMILAFQRLNKNLYAEPTSK